MSVSLCVCRSREFNSGHSTVQNLNAVTQEEPATCTKLTFLLSCVDFCISKGYFSEYFYRVLLILYDDRKEVILLSIVQIITS
jgi:hypothetical protein